MFSRSKRNDTDSLEKLLKDYKDKQTYQTLQRIYELFLKVPLYYESLQPEIGPDGFPYVSLYLRKQNNIQNETSLKALSEKALEEGFGATVDKFGKDVDWVFSLGDFIPLAKAGVLVTHQGLTGFQTNTLREETTVQIGTPNEEIMPALVRKRLREFLITRVGIPAPKFYLLYNPKDNPPHTMIFNFSRSDFPTESQYQNTLGAISWFLPKVVFAGTIKDDKNIFYEI